MVYTDWTLSPNIDQIAIDNTDNAPGGTTPCISFRSNSSLQHKMMYPTNGTINGVNIRGINQGQLETWLKYNAESFDNISTLSFGLCFRISNTSDSSLTGYVLQFRITNVGPPSPTSTSQTAQFLHYSSGTSTSIGGIGTTALPNVFNALTWYKIRTKWWVIGADLAMSFDLDYNDGNGYSTYINTRLDVGNAHRDESTTNTIALDPWGYPTNSTSLFKIDSTAVYST